MLLKIADFVIYPLTQPQMADKKKKRLQTMHKSTTAFLVSQLKTENEVHKAK